MAVYDDLLEWSIERPMWQRDALRRLVVSGPLTDDDLAELTRLALVEAGQDPGFQAIPLASDHLPTEGTMRGEVRLRAIATPRNVNALPPDARLEFEPEGLTVIYGDNASGKSGYVRILKRVCRTRGTPERVLPNVLRSDAGEPTAQIEYRVGEDARSHQWSDAAGSVDELAAVSVFDRACAAVYVNSENEVAYRPLGLDLLDALAQAAQALRRRLEAIRDANAQRLSGPPEAFADSPVLRTVWPPSADISQGDIQACASWSSEALEDLERTERVLSATTPAEAITGLRARKAELTRAIRRCATASEAIVAADAIRDAALRHDAAEAAVREARVVAVGASDIRGVGGALWRALWMAAQRYSMHEAYPQHRFPNTEADARCVLCGQPISEDARTRFEALRLMVEDELGAAAQSASAEVERLRSILQASVDGESAEVAVADLRATDPEAGKRVALFLGGVFDRANQALVWLRDRVDQPRAEDPIDPSDWLRDRGLPLDVELVALQRATDPAELDGLRAEARDLRARRWVSENANSIIAESARRKMRAAVGVALGTCDTTPITVTSGRLTDQYVTEALRADFSREMRNLIPGRVLVRIVRRGGYGSTYHRLQLATTTTLNAKVSEVVSDGEFRAVALANFLAEIAHANTRSGIVLDDPVTSLDHLYRSRIAARLVQEAAVRQVIVFTHDLVFLQDLVTVAERDGVPIGFRRLTISRTHVGLPEAEQPWDGMKVGRRAEALQVRLNELRVLYDSGELETYERGVERWYSRLRSTWERAVEEVLFVDAIGRYRSQVKTNNLISLKVWMLDEADVFDLSAAMTRSSGLIDAHDQPAAANRPVPSPDELRDDLQFLQDWVSRMRAKHR